MGTAIGKAYRYDYDSRHSTGTSPSPTGDATNPTRFFGSVWDGTDLSLSETHSTVFSPIQSIKQEPTSDPGVGGRMGGWMRTGKWPMSIPKYHMPSRLS